MPCAISNNEIVFAGLMPHAPILAAGVGHTQQHIEARHTIRAMRDVAHHAVATRPDTIVLISPHSPRKAGAFGIWKTPILHGSLEPFGAPENRVDLPLDADFADRLEKEATQRGLHTWRITDATLDYGATVPLSYLSAAGWQSETVVVGLNHSGPLGLDEFGEAIAATAAALGRRVAVIASGDMSHRLAPNAPLGFNAEGGRFDHTFIELLRAGSFQEIRRMDSKLIETAGEDVVDSTRVALAASGYATAGGTVLSYEGPFGVGYGVAILAEQPQSAFSTTTAAATDTKPLVSHRADLPAVARLSVTTRLNAGPVDSPFVIAGDLADAAAVFVTIRMANGALRGCMGSAAPTQKDLVRETWLRAREAAFQDPRFPALRMEELVRVRFSVSILGKLEPITSLSELDPARYGVLVHANDGRQGILLPAIKGIDSAAEQVRIAKHKASIDVGEPCRMQRFTTQLFWEPPFKNEDD